MPRMTIKDAEQFHHKGNRGVIGRLLKATRKELGYSQTAVARVLGLSQSTIAKIEAGTKKEEFSVICRMVALYQIDSAKFIFKFTGDSAKLRERMK